MDGARSRSYSFFGCNIIHTTDNIAELTFHLGNSLEGSTERSDDDTEKRYEDHCSKSSLAWAGKVPY